MTTDPIEQARDDMIRTALRFEAVGAVESAVTTFEHSILRYHPDVVRLVETARGSQRRHLVVEDCWYSCPKAVREDGESAYCGDSSRNVCECGADAWNAIVDAALVPFKEVQE